MTTDPQPAPERATPLPPVREIEAAFQGLPWSGEWEWGNTVLVRNHSAYVPNHTSADAAGQHEDELGEGDPGAWGLADSGGMRQVVRIDTNYKPSGYSDHPVDLSRTDAVALAAAVLTAVEDTFHVIRVGQLRPAEAAELLLRCEEVDVALASLRSHALGDLLERTGLDPDIAPEPADDDAVQAEGR